MEKIKISYNDYGNMLDLLYTRLKNKDFVFFNGVPRGGLPIAVHLSHFLETDLLTIGEISQMSEDMDLVPDDEKQTILIIDDICDTGDTFECMSERLDAIGLTKYFKIEWAVLFYKPHSTFKPDYFVQETKDWIVFPWEPMSEIPNRNLYEHLGSMVK